jgi:hypothetical protein
LLGRWTQLRVVQAAAQQREALQQRLRAALLRQLLSVQARVRVPAQPLQEPARVQQLQAQAPVRPFL